MGACLLLQQRDGAGIKPKTDYGTQVDGLPIKGTLSRFCACARF